MNTYAVACGLSKTDGICYSTSITLHTMKAANEDEAKGAAVSKAIDLKPGFSIDNILCMQVICDKEGANNE